MVYFHYSNVESTYKKHVKDLLSDLQNAGILIIEDVQNYPTHGGLKDHYPGFLRNTIKNIIEQ